ARKQAEASAAQEREELQKKRAELEHVARVATLGELTAAGVHEIAQPLGAILANSSAGIDILDAPEPDLREARAALSDICADTERAAEVIGLAISRTIVERHSGKVWAANNPDRGATFSIR